MGFLEFEELGISTQTVIADSGVMMDIEEFFKMIPIDDVEGGGEIVASSGMAVDVKALPQETTRRRSKKNSMPIELSAKENEVIEKLGAEDYHKNHLVDDKMWVRLLPLVRCRAMYFKNEIKMHPSMSFQTRERYFRNALNVVLSLGSKLVNFKLSKNGKFQLTGCKYMWHAQVCVVAFLQRIRQWCPHVCTQNIRVYFQTVMTNVDFNIGHTIDRSHLDERINSQTPYYSLLETSFGYTGVNIKFPIEQDWWKIMKVPVVYLSCQDDSISSSEVVLDTLIQETDRQRFRVKRKYNTFLVFHSGNVIMSGMSPQLMKKDYGIFTSLLAQWSKDIRETIHT